MFLFSFFICMHIYIYNSIHCSSICFSLFFAVLSSLFSVYLFKSLMGTHIYWTVWFVFKKRAKKKKKCHQRLCHAKCVCKRFSNKLNKLKPGKIRTYMKKETRWIVNEWKQKKKRSQLTAIWLMIFFPLCCCVLLLFFSFIAIANEWKMYEIKVTH